MGTIQKDVIAVIHRIDALEKERDRLKEQLDILINLSAAKQEKIEHLLGVVKTTQNSNADLLAKLTAANNRIDALLDQLELADDLILSYESADVPDAPATVAAFAASEQGEAFMVDLDTLVELFAREGYYGARNICRTLAKRLHDAKAKNA